MTKLEFLASLKEEYGDDHAMVREAERLIPAEPVVGDIRALFDKAIGTKKGCKFTFSFETEQQALRAFEYLADLGSLGALR